MTSYEPKAKEIEDDAVIARPAVQSAAQAMLRALTARADANLADAVGDMDAAWREAGWQAERGGFIGSDLPLPDADAVTSRSAVR